MQFRSQGHKVVEAMPNQLRRHMQTVAREIFRVLPHLNPAKSVEREPKRLGAGEAGSFSFALTHVDRQQGRKEDAIPDFEKFAKAQNDFWKECEGCYLFGQQTHTVDIA